MIYSGEKKKPIFPTDHELNGTTILMKYYAVSKDSYRRSQKVSKTFTTHCSVSKEYISNDSILKMYFFFFLCFLHVLKWTCFTLKLF